MTTSSSIKTEGISMLDQMVSGATVTKSKAAAPARTLTPLVGEANTPLIPNHPVLGSLPDDPDIILGRIRDARKEVVAILDSLDRVAVFYGQPATALEAAALVEEQLTETEKARRATDRKVAASAGPAASKADQAAAARAQARIDAEAPVVDSEDRIKSKAELLAAMIGEGTEAVVEAPTMDAAVEAVADFNAKFAAQAAAAQAATFESTSAGHALLETPAEAARVQGAVTAADPTGWVCPTHGGFTVRTSPRRNVQFRVCPEQGCGEYEKV